MARAAKSKPVCIYCQAAPGVTKDHVFPSAWYPKTTPSNIQKRTVPCCLPCNKRLHEAEDAVVLDLLFICNPELPEIAGVHENVCRAWQPEHARDPDDAKHRAGKTLKILRTMEWANPTAGAPVVFVKKDGGLYRAASLARALDRTALQTVIEKFIRGLHYLEMKALVAAAGRHRSELPDPLLPLDMKFQHSLVPNPLIRAVDLRLKLDDFAPELIAAIMASPRFAMFGPGFEFRRLRTQVGTSMWLFRLWGQLDLVAFAYPSVVAAEVERRAGLRP